MKQTASNSKRKRKRNPISRSDVKQAIKLYRAFRESDPDEITTVLATLPRAAIAVGHVDYIGYNTTHGTNVVEYEHKFRNGSRPLLCASADGKQLLLLGGRFTFTELGIVDIDARGKQVIPKDHGK